MTGSFQAGAGLIRRGRRCRRGRSSPKARGSRQGRLNLFTPLLLQPFFAPAAAPNRSIKKSPSYKRTRGSVKSEQYRFRVQKIKTGSSGAISNFKVPVCTGLRRGLLVLKSLLRKAENATFISTKSQKSRVKLECLFPATGKPAGDKTNLGFPDNALKPAAFSPAEKGPQYSRGAVNLNIC